ncbi:MAG: 3-dehydroquinate synthase [Paludibacteraceae bacterium]|nr:3-dehydroquinate synthase [Paludibacteraceae bacterium]
MSQKVYITKNLVEDLKNECDGRSPKGVFILVDSNTRQLCLPLLMKDEFFKQVHVIEIKPNDDHKTLESIASVWQYLSENGATRKSIMINLGGGMVTDLGGFAASTFKRGMDYVNVPTTLLGAVDAAVGGKTGINFAGLKNEIGVINSSKSVLINADFFRSLDHNNFLSGYAEMIKHGLISEPKVWNNILSYDLEKINYEALPELLLESISVKEKVVAIDPTEKGLRKVLNFGHTVGHSFESFAMETGAPVLHGYAVAWGMISELYLSYKLLGFPKQTLALAVQMIKENYGVLKISCNDYEHLYDLMTHDKKNEGDGRILFSLLKDIGEVEINVSVSKKDILDSLDFYCEAVGLG